MGTVAEMRARMTQAEFLLWSRYHALLQQERELEIEAMKSKG